MSNEHTDDTRTELGLFLKNARLGQGMSLRDVEQSTGKQVSNAYLSQLESGRIAKPSPHVLFALSAALGLAYETLMERAGYISPSATGEPASRRGMAAGRAIENLTDEEERALLEYLAFFRQQRTKGR